MKSKNAFRKNGYPSKFIDICIKKIFYWKKGSCIFLKKEINMFTSVYRQKLPLNKVYFCLSAKTSSK